MVWFICALLIIFYNHFAVRPLNIYAAQCILRPVAIQTSQRKWRPFIGHACPMSGMAL